MNQIFYSIRIGNIKGYQEKEDKNYFQAQVV